MIRRTSKSAALALVIVLIACGASGFLKGFQVAMRSSGPLVSSLVQSGAINQTKADAIVTDFSDGAQCGVTASEAFSAIPKELPANEKKARKFEAAQSALVCFRSVVQRRNFASHPRIQNAANIAEGILASLVIFYSSTGARMGVADRNIVTANDEKELEERLKAKVKELKEAMQP